MKGIIYTLMMLYVGIDCFGQHTIIFQGESPKATIDDVAWIAGHWQGKAFGGVVEEVWTKPLGKSMMGSFKMVIDDEVSFYELCIIREVGETIILQLKHFHGDLKGWEEKEETVDFPLVKIEEDKAYFDNFTFEMISDTEMHVYVVISIDGETKKEVPFKYSRL